MSRYAKQGKAPGNQDGLMMARANPSGQTTLALLGKKTGRFQLVRSVCSVWEIAGVDRGI